MNTVSMQRIISLAIGGLVALALIFAVTMMFDGSQPAGGVQGPGATAADR